MKIVVAHPDKQYVAGLLEGLAKKGWLEAYYSQFISNKLPNVSFGEKIDKFLQKRRYNDALIPKNKLNHMGLRYVISKTLKLLFGSEKDYPTMYKTYDGWVAKQLSQVKYDILLSYENANLCTFKAAKRANKVTVLDLAQVHQDDVLRIMSELWSEDKIYLEREVVNPYKARALEYTDYVITLSSFARQTMLDKGWREDQTYIVNLGINPSLFYSDEEKKIKNEAFTFLFVGSMMLRKGVEDLLLTWMEIREHINARLVFVGPMADAEALIKTHLGYIEYYPFMHHEDLANMYRSADVYVLPSLLDSWAQTVVEAMACGTAVVVSDHTGAKDAVAKGGGWVIPAGNRTALKNQLIYCYENQDEVATKSAAAAVIAKEYTWSNYHQQITEVFNDIARKEEIS
jgi:glycosyltransferase involved in cell wall biosynthesis